MNYKQFIINYPYLILEKLKNEEKEKQEMIKVQIENEIYFEDEYKNVENIYQFSAIDHFWYSVDAVDDMGNYYISDVKKVYDNFMIKHFSLNNKINKIKKNIEEKYEKR